MSVIETVETSSNHVPSGWSHAIHRSESPRLALDRRGVRIALGAVWFFDGALQLQPAMFTTRFAYQVVAPASTGQPGWVAWPVLQSAHLIASHPIVTDLGFALVQLALGVLLIVPRTARAALVASVAWAFGVWVAGEGLGGIAGGTASIFTGAPGAALLYGVLAIAARPTRGPATSRRSGGAVDTWFTGAWAALWIGLGLLALLPANRSAGRVADQLTQIAGSVPVWLGRMDSTMAGAVRQSGWVGVALLTVVPIVVGLAGLGSKRARYLGAWLGVGLAVGTWVVGESFGQLGSGIATDPNTGPLLVVAALALLRIPDFRTRAGGHIESSSSSLKLNQWRP